MKVFCLALMALWNTNNFSAVEAFASSSRALSSSAVGSGSFHARHFQRFHHLGDLEHDPVAEPVGVSSTHEKDERSTESSSSPEVVVVYDTVEVLLDDTAFEMAMTSVAALFVALGLFLGGGILKPRPALAEEPFWSVAPTPILTQRSESWTPSPSLESPSWNTLQSHIHSNSVTGDN